MQIRQFRRERAARLPSARQVGAPRQPLSVVNERHRFETGQLAVMGEKKGLTEHVNETTKVQGALELALFVDMSWVVGR